MRCSIEECSGSYEVRGIVHPVRYRDVLSPDTVRGIEATLQERSEPSRTVALYEYAV